MRILFISKDLTAADVAYRLKNEGNEVKLYIHNKRARENFDNLLIKTSNWKSELAWVGKTGLIVFDDVGFGKEQDKLRKKGYIVFGGCELSDKLELEREHAQNIFEKYGIKTFPLKDFDNIDDAVMYAKQNPKPWVVKQNDEGSKILNYVSYFDDGRDAISVLKNYLQNKKINKNTVSLHHKIEGVEIAVARSFNGSDWVGPIKMNIEHKKFLHGDLGPTTSEMGTLAWFDDNEDNKLFNETLSNLKPYLKEINFRGEIDINCIVNESGAFPVEATPRFGSPIVHLHTSIQDSPWGEYLYAVASGGNYDMKWKKGYGIVILLAVPPFPYSKYSADNLFYGVNIFLDNVRDNEMSNIHFEEVAVRTGSDQLYISDNSGYVLYVSGVGHSVKEAQDTTYALAKKIIIPKVLYRDDIGTSFLINNAKKLKEWGYIRDEGVMNIQSFTGYSLEDTFPLSE